ncbi:hypothetical protein TNCV_1088971 [Trichonephila clavipes]|uniref:Uncharacterized protein n=1 Tax=Trichonephila clavipes TaxID=2585209 RepID=A0A8X6SZD5_TRICX|nr:hypothetical protein TNCV_1088971 [Trichonephila clavipes]
MSPLAAKPALTCLRMESNCAWMTEMVYSFHAASSLCHTSSTKLAGDGPRTSPSATQDQMFSVGDRSTDRAAQGNIQISCVSRRVGTWRATCNLALSYWCRALTQISNASSGLFRDTRYVSESNQGLIWKDDIQPLVCVSSFVVRRTRVVDPLYAALSREAEIMATVLRVHAAANVAATVRGDTGQGRL